MSDAHKHDHWVEHLPDEELDRLVADSAAKEFIAEHDWRKARFRSDRLRREQHRRTQE